MSPVENLSCAFLDRAHGEESKQLAISFQPFLQPSTLISTDVLGQPKRGMEAYLTKKSF